MDNRTGRIVWTDLTVPDAEGLRDFYAEVVGWTPTEVPMGGYADYNMTDGEGSPVAGVCHAKGVNEGIPPVWMVYVTVDDLDASLEAVRKGGGEVVREPRPMGEWTMAIIRDPAGAVLTLGRKG